MEVDVRAGLQKLAERLGGKGAAITEAQRLSGGASMETWAFGFDGKGGPERLILRRRSVPFDEETARSILAHAREHLQPWQRVRRLEFGELPKTISGKIRRVELRGREEQLAHGELEPPENEWRDDIVKGH